MWTTEKLVWKIWSTSLQELPKNETTAIPHETDDYRACLGAVLGQMAHARTVTRFRLDLHDPKQRHMTS